MKSPNVSRCLLALLSAAATAVLFAPQAGAAGVDVPSASLPVIYPDGVYRTPDQVHATFNGPGLTIVLTNIEHLPFGSVSRHPGGLPNDEIEDFSSTMTGLVSLNGGPFVGPASGNGPVSTLVVNRLSSLTGTFQTEMLSMQLTGSSPFGPFMIRESPTLQSLGQTSITDIGGGMYHIDSFFDVFTELSIDGGQNWIPSQGSSHVVLTPVPEPGTLALAALAGGLLLWRRARRQN